MHRSISALIKNRVEKFKNGESNYKTYSSKWNGNSAAPFVNYIIREGEAVGQMYGILPEVCTLLMISII